jgi:hypothetical protein
MGVFQLLGLSFAVLMLGTCLERRARWGWMGASLARGFLRSLASARRRVWVLALLALRRVGALACGRLACGLGVSLHACVGDELRANLWGFGRLGASPGWRLTSRSWPHGLASGCLSVLLGWRLLPDSASHGHTRLRKRRVSESASACVLHKSKRHCQHPHGTKGLRVRNSPTCTLSQNGYGTTWEGHD